MSKLRKSLYTIIFEHHTRAGWLFDVGLILAVVASVLVVSRLACPACAAQDHGPSSSFCRHCGTALTNP